MIYMTLKKNYLILFFPTLSVLFFLPSTGVALLNIAWTPLAERYLYISSAGIAIFIAYSLMTAKPNKSLNSKIIDTAFVSLIIFFSIVTYSRNLCWKSPLKLYKDTVEKSPTFGPIRNDYAILLKRNGFTREAIIQFKIAQNLYKGKGRERITNNLLLAESYKKSRTVLTKEICNIYDSTKNKEAKKKILVNVLRTLNDALSNASEGEKRELIKQMIHYNAEGYKLSHDPFYLYKQGQLFLLLGNREKAIHYFYQTCEKSDDFYTKPACKLYKKLSRELEESVPSS